MNRTKWKTEMLTMPAEKLLAMQSDILFNNTDVKLLNSFDKWLKEKGIKHLQAIDICFVYPLKRFCFPNHRIWIGSLSFFELLDSLYVYNPLYLGIYRNWDVLFDMKRTFKTKHNTLLAADIACRNKDDFKQLIDKIESIRKNEKITMGVYNNFIHIYYGHKSFRWGTKT